MNDFAASEQRLSIALDRIDYGIDRLQTVIQAAAQQQIAAQTARDQADAAAGAGVDGLDGEVAALHRRQAAALERAQQRLAAAGAEVAQLAAANDQLVAANRALIEVRDIPAGIDAVHTAQKAEIEALRAARAAEVAQMGDILAALETMLGISETPPLPHADSDDVVPDDAPVAAGYDEDIAPLPPEGRIVRFGQDGDAPSDQARVPDTPSDEEKP